MKDSISPEEKLLRLIKGAKKPEAIAENKITAPVAGRQEPKASLKNPLFPLWRVRSLFINVNINQVIRGAFILSCIYLGFSLIYPWTGLGKVKLPKIAAIKAAEQGVKPGTETKPVEFYLESAKDRQIFGAANSAGSNGSPANINVDLMKNISLVGIISGETPQAVIEDKASQKVYYVTKNQFIGEFKVEDIQQGKVIISYQNQKFELYL